jgi:hypothetical protein
MGRTMEVANDCYCQILAQKVSTTETEVDVLRQLALFCCAGLFVFVLLKTYGLDLGPGFF